MATVLRPGLAPPPHLFKPRRNENIYGFTKSFALCLTAFVATGVDTVNGAAYHRTVQYQSSYNAPLPLLTAPPAAAPFKQIDWPNPQRPRYTSPAWQDNPLALRQPAAAPPISQTEWPNPRPPRYQTPAWAAQTPVVLTAFIATGVNADAFSFGRTVLYQDTYQPPLPLTTVTAVAPFFETEWPNPRGPQRPPFDWEASFPLPLQTIVPSNQYDWPNPKGKAPTHQLSFTDSFKLPLQTIVPANQYDWPVPKGPRRPVQDWQETYPATFTTVGFNQYDWPNPRGPQPLNRGFTDQFKLPLQTIVGSNQYGWPNPQRPRLNEQLGWLNQGLGLSTVVVYPATITFDYPNPRGPQQYNRGFTDSFKLPLQTIVGSNQYDWPNPRGPRSNPDFILGSPYALTTVVAAPFAQTDWPNPSGARRVADLRTWLQTGFLEEFGEPFAQYDWPVPRGRRSNQDWQQRTPQQILSSITAFAQYDWPDPRGARRSVVDWVVGTPYVLASAVQAPFHQTEWPVPRGAKPKVADHTDSFKLPLQTIRPSNQYDWPVPRGARRNEQLGWFRPAFQALTTVFAYPAKITFDWPNPLRPRSHPFFVRGTPDTLGLTTPVVPAVGVAGQQVHVTFVGISTTGPNIVLGYPFPPVTPVTPPGPPKHSHGHFHGPFSPSVAFDTSSGAVRVRTTSSTTSSRWRKSRGRIRTGKGKTTTRDDP